MKDTGTKIMEEKSGKLQIILIRMAGKRRTENSM